MSFGNGLFGFLRWLQADPSLIIWESFLYTVLPCWKGSLIGIYVLPTPSTTSVKFLFACFCAVVAVLVAYAAYKGGVDKVSFKDTSANTTALPSSQPAPIPSRLSWLLLAVVSFFGGVYLVPNIGVGPALTTYLGLVIMGFPVQAAVVTGIITGGWVCILPFALNLTTGDVPMTLWLMVIPGVYLGAKSAPLVHAYCGMQVILGAFAVLLLFNAALFTLFS
eukprot:CAMPEP_0185022482 /NCGR_PEP_ID=MMETSP1103-20130426/5186_1 /TAXON_ID=36769 /ORGANISM="Paraphysomonas bandaiensis, Strain Caron Lab Isolate" /LENGTH=220 /DNA_ID=CAMNT_0027554561 /DNA_START=300 /DNA_END=962 /DNA_ORIENTATION=+